ncbi:MAG: beta-N-acetylhexosaminidase [Magnetovibrio sp.]|nr:beta-N-acetylhexosaminidase [Magnetovibrio sp.]
MRPLPGSSARSSLCVKWAVLSSCRAADTQFRHNMSVPSIPVIYGCAGLELSRAELEFFRRSNPIGLILFTRNCEAPDQIKKLIADFKNAVNVVDPLILIDQEGGRVQRLGPPNWPAYPAVGCVAAVANIDPARGLRYMSLLGRLLASDLAPLGITVNCAPVLDVLQPETHEIIGNRALGDDPSLVTRFGRALSEGLLAGGVLPVIKHLPGHGRARVDSHTELPRVDTPLAELESVDFLPFHALRDMPLAMTAHVVFEALDPDRPATTSPRALQSAVRNRIGYSGLLMSDDICMRALNGPIGLRARDAQLAGCDLILHCSGDITEMEVVAGVVRQTSPSTANLLARAAALRRSSAQNDGFNAEKTYAALQDALTG